MSAKKVSGKSGDEVKVSGHATPNAKKVVIPTIEQVCAFMRVCTLEQVATLGNAYKLRGVFHLGDVVPFGPITCEVVAMRDDGTFSVRPINDMKARPVKGSTSPRPPSDEAKDEPSEESDEPNDEPDVVPVPAFCAKGASVHAKYEGAWLKGEVLSVQAKKGSATIYFAEDDSNASIAFANLRARKAK